jgi:ArsR family transcriptional regulator
VLKERLERLASSGVCGVKDVGKYSEDLRRLAKKTINDREVELQSKVLKALSDPLRLKILRLLSVREMCECELIVAFGLSQPTASHHLEILEEAGLVKSRREGKWIFFKLSNPSTMNFVDALVSKVEPVHRVSVRRKRR